jgi:hypothetical protein
MSRVGLMDCVASEWMHNSQLKGALERVLCWHSQLQAACYLLLPSKEQLYLHKGLSGLGRLQTLQLDRRSVLRSRRHSEFQNNEQKDLCCHLLV